MRLVCRPCAALGPAAPVGARRVTRAALGGLPNGIPFSQLNAKQKDVIEALVAEYAPNARAGMNAVIELRFTTA